MRPRAYSQEFAEGTKEGDWEWGRKFLAMTEVPQRCPCRGRGSVGSAKLRKVGDTCLNTRLNKTHKIQHNKI